MPRQFNREFAESPRLASDPDLAFVFFDDAVTDAQPQPHALPDILGREEWFEDLPQVLRVDADAVVPDYQFVQVVVNLAFDAHRRPVTVGELLLLDGVGRVLD